MDVESVGRKEVGVKAGVFVLEEGEDEGVSFGAGGGVAGQEG